MEGAEFQRRVEEVVQAPTWVVDGNYTAVRNVIWERADAVVFLDLPLHVVLCRLVPRTVRMVVGRTELWNGNREPVSNLWSFNPERSVIAWSITHHAEYRRRYTEMMADLAWSHLTFIRLCTTTQVTQLLKNAPDYAQPKE